MTAIPVIETERLTLRAPDLRDHAREVAFYADAEHSRFVGGPRSALGAWDAIVGRLGHWAALGFGFWHLDARETGRYVGRVGLIEPWGWPEAELAWSLMPDATGQGYATEAAHAARAHIYEVMGRHTAISLIDPENKPSEAVARRLGASPEGTARHPELGVLHVWRHPSPEKLQ